jgi:hypothetical protein
MGLARVRLRVSSLAVAVAIVALVFNHFRPVGPLEAKQLALAFAKSGQPYLKDKVVKLTANVHWIKGKNWYLITWSNPINEDDTDLPYDVLVNHDGRCSVFLGHAQFH